MKPTVPFQKADQLRLRQLKLEQSQVPGPGRVMFCRGRRVLGYGDVGKLGNARYIPDAADTVCVAMADFADVKEWIG